MRLDAEDRHYRQQIKDMMMTELTPQDTEYLDKVFTYHPPKDGQPFLYETLRAAAKQFAATVLQYCPPSRERSIALTHIETAAFFVNGSIARNT